MSGAPPKPGQPAPQGGPVFDEASYMRLNPDVLVAVQAGKFGSGREHFERFGRAEGRLVALPPGLPHDRVLITAPPHRLADRSRTPAGVLDSIRLSPAGGLYIAGWVNDALDRLDCIELHAAGWFVSLAGASLARVRRPDVETALHSPQPQLLGFWGFLYTGQALPAGTCSVVLKLKSGAELALMAPIEPVEDLELRSQVLGGIAEAKYTGIPYFHAVATIEAGIGAQLVDYNRMLVKRAVAGAYVEPFHTAGRSPKASIVVCLYGRPEYLPIQQALFARLPGAQDYEFIYVCNSPELAEPLLRAAAIARLAYGLDLTLVLLGANAGFAAANNEAARFARSDRLVFMNPDVFPRDPDWARAHLAVLNGAPPAQTSLFGAPLYYNDGSLMHAGMFFELDTVPGFTLARKADVSILRVEHYGKGAPPAQVELLRPRPVPAVTGAFISIAAPWFESLGGFSEAYLLGHYEDADLCLRSLEAGRPAWVHDLRLWHLEGKGSHRAPVHEGASVINRWQFTRNWLALMQAGLLGATPSHPALEGAA